MSGADTISPVFTAPDGLADNAVLRFALVVTDTSNAASTADEMSVLVDIGPPLLTPAPTSAPTPAPTPTTAPTLEPTTEPAPTTAPTTEQRVTMGGITVLALGMPAGATLHVQPVPSGHASLTPPTGRTFRAGPVDITFAPPLEAGQTATVCLEGSGVLARYDGSAWVELESSTTRNRRGSLHLRGGHGDIAVRRARAHPVAYAEARAHNSAHPDSLTHAIARPNGVTHAIANGHTYPDAYSCATAHCHGDGRARAYSYASPHCYRESAVPTPRPTPSATPAATAALPIEEGGDPAWVWVITGLVVLGFIAAGAYRRWRWL